MLIADYGPPRSGIGDTLQAVRRHRFADPLAAHGKTDLTAGTVSDVFDIEYANYAQYQANGVLAELPVEDPDIYRQSVLEAYQTDGVQYALPTTVTCSTRPASSTRPPTGPGPRSRLRQSS